MAKKMSVVTDLKVRYQMVKSYAALTAQEMIDAELKEGHKVVAMTSSFKMEKNSFKDWVISSPVIHVVFELKEPITTTVKTKRYVE